MNLDFIFINTFLLSVCVYVTLGADSWIAQQIQIPMSPRLPVKIWRKGSKHWRYK
jgi:hypothetical protein